MLKPKFSVTNNLVTYISRIEYAKALIDTAPLVPAWESKFRDEALSRTVHYGTKIEGNDLTEDQALQVVRLPDIVDSQEVIAKTGLIARERDIQEVINYRNVIHWIDKQQQFKTVQIFSEDTLRTIHRLTVVKLIEQQYIGSYRDKQVIVKSAGNGNVVFRPPVAGEIPYLVKEFMDWGKASESKVLHPLFQAAISHYQIVYIHPFIEGNGRTARAFANFLLYSLGYDFKKFFSLEKYFDSDVEAYYQALLSVQHTGDDLTYWLEYFCYGVAIEIEKIKSQVLKLSKDLKLQKQLGKQVALSERQIMLLEVLQNQDEVTSDDMQKILPNVSVDTVLRDIKDLISKGIVEKRGVTKGVRYTLKN